MDQRSAILIDKISGRLERAGKLPLHCDLSQIGDLHLASVYSEKAPSSLIRENIQCGMDFDQNIAILKALVECVERLAIAEGIASRHPACQTTRSDGFAAFPVQSLGKNPALRLAREHAYAEALERFSWARWWDDTSIGANVQSDSEIEATFRVSSLIERISQILPVKQVLIIEPYTSDNDFTVLIFFFVLQNLGVVSGGACAKRTDRELAMLRALGELSRHMVCAKKVLSGVAASTFYEKRLAYMASPNTSALLNERIAKSGYNTLRIPRLAIDEKIPHSFEEIVAVHRCLFEDQPPFVGGALERFCL